MYVSGFAREIYEGRKRMKLLNQCDSGFYEFLLNLTLNSKGDIFLQKKKKKKKKKEKGKEKGKKKEKIIQKN